MWQNLTASEMRIELMRDLRKIGLGLDDLDQFNLGLMLKIRSKMMKERGHEATQEGYLESIGGKNKR